VSFLSGEICYFDIYVRLRPGRFIMLHRAGSPFPEDRLVAYLKRGVHTFYLRREAQESYMSYCDQVTAEYHRKQWDGLVAQSVKDLNLGALALGHLKNAGVPLARLARAVEFFKTIQELAHNVGLLENEAVQHFIGDQHALRHGSATVMVAYLLMEALDFTSTRLQHAVGLGALFHDVGMIEGESFHQHPIASARILGATNLFAPVILQGIEQHHERRNRVGFPRGLGAGSIGRVAEIIGFADEFVHLVQEAALDSEIEPILAAKVRLADGFSSEVLSAFERIFAVERTESI
jgi:HD-GYP domain-containing protein (c-di-GMP phosphodiesterase class II)